MKDDHDSRMEVYENFKEALKNADPSIPRSKRKIRGKPLITKTGIPAWLIPKPKTDIGIYTEQTWDELLQRVSAGETVKSICDDSHMPAYKLMLQYIHSSEETREEYYRARESGSLFVEEQILDIADAVDNELEDVNRSKLRIDSRKWLLGVWNRRRYGDTKQIDMNHQVVDLTAAIDSANDRLALRSELLGDVIDVEVEEDKDNSDE